MYLVKSPLVPPYMSFLLVVEEKGTETIIQRHVWFPPDDPSSVGGWTNILIYISFGLLSVKACTVCMRLI